MMVDGAAEATTHVTLPATEQLLVEGGDARIALNPDGRNKYGNRPIPDPSLIALGSSTATGISCASYAASNCLRDRLLLGMNSEPDTVIYASELARIRQELAQLCGLSDAPDTEYIFGASGTDIHLIAAQLIIAEAGSATLAIMVDAAESGSGVPSALAGRNFSNSAPLGQEEVKRTTISDDETEAAHRIDVTTVPIRLANGSPRHPAEVDAEFTSQAKAAIVQGRRVLLVLTDVSKTGIIAPSPACAQALQSSFPDKIDVLVDACQFRIAPTTLRVYLKHGFMIALTGSKFMTGPSFSGLLLLPSPVAKRFSMKPLPQTLLAYSSHAEWPTHWNTVGLPGNAINFGLLLRWEAALVELRRFNAVPEHDIETFLQAFARAIRKRLSNDPLFELLATPNLDRHPLTDTMCWDNIQTIFSFLLLHPETHLPLSQDQTREIYQLLQADLSAHGEFNLGDWAPMRFQLGQPVTCGQRHGLAISALRLCASSRMVVEATTCGKPSTSAVIERALSSLDKTARLIQSGLIK